ncbi:MAG: divalent-cation tolerance protein CutA [Candidatus Asgardarchaeum californiense]|nr:MAG: divalent-cation tolerance protein CutA [Candidatus Asgardarchaeum californiense]
MGSIKEARKIAKILVGEKFVACVNIIPNVESIYRWQGNIEEDNECVILAKTNESNIDKTIKRIKELHSYDVPDIVSFPITKGLKEYLNWVKDETT